MMESWTSRESGESESESDTIYRSASERFEEVPTEEASSALTGGDLAWTGGVHKGESDAVERQTQGGH